MKKNLWIASSLGLLVVQLFPLFAVDKDKAPLFSTFYGEGTGGPWVLVMNADRKYQLTAPDGKTIAGEFVASNREVGLLGEGVVRHFEWKVEDGNLTLVATAKDGPRAGTALGELPPTRADGRAVFWSAQEWLKRQMERPAPVVKPEDAWRSLAPATLEAIRGEYQIRDAQNRIFGLNLRADTTFEYIDADGARTVGLYTYDKGELKLESRTHRRSLGLSRSAAGLQVQRLPADALRLRDPLGEMAPLDLAPVAWTLRTPLREEIKEPKEAKEPWDWRRPRTPERAETGGTVEEQVVALMRANRPDEAAKRIQAAMQQNPRSARLQLLSENLEGLLKADSINLTLHSICTRGAQAAEDARSINTKDSNAGVLKDSLLARDQAAAKLAADTRDRFLRDPYADVRGRPAEMKAQAREAALELAKGQEAATKKAQEEEEITGVKVPVLGNVGIRGENSKSKAWRKYAETLGTLGAEATELGR